MRLHFGFAHPISARDGRSDERGFALIAVIIGAAFIAILALTLMNYARSVAVTGALFVSDVETKSWTEAGLNRILIAYVRPGDPLRQQLQPDGRKVSWEFHGRMLALQAQAESGKIDVNAGDRTHISNVLDRAIENDQLRLTILNRLDEARSSGRKIQSIGEILPPFERMTLLRDALEAYFTVYTNQTGIDFSTAPQLVIETIPGLAPQLAAELVRRRASDRRLPIGGLPPEIARRFVPQRPIYTFRSETQSGFTKVAVMRATVLYSEHNKPIVLSRGVVGGQPASAEADVGF